MANIMGFYVELDKAAIDKIIRERIEKTLGEEKVFKLDKVKRWTETISREGVRDLVKLQKPFKFLVSCSINQRTGGAFVQHSSCFADPLHDVITATHWINDVMHCFVNVYALTLF